MKRSLLIILIIFCVACAGSGASLKKETTVATISSFFPEGEEETKAYQEEDLEKVAVEQPPTHDPEEEKQTWLHLDEQAPFDGVLLNPDGMAYILSEYEALKLRSGAALEKQRQSDLAKLNLETGQLRLELGTTRKKGNIVIRGRDEEILRLQKINKDIREDKSDLWDDLFLGVGSGAVGILVGVLIYSLAQ